MSNLNDIFFTPAANQELTYDQILEDVQRYFAENHASTIAEAGEGNAERATSLLKELMEHYIVKRKYALDGLSTKELCSKLYEDMAGYSFLKKWIYKPGVEEVNINAYNDIEVIESSGRSIKIPDKFSSPQHAIDVIRRMLNACGMVIDDTMPSIVGFLDKNIRISVDKTPIVDADVGVNASIRIVNQQTVSEEKLLNSGSATAEMLHFLTACIRYGVSVCIAGSTGSGKSSLINLVPRFYDTSQGQVLVDGVDVRDYDLKALRDKIGYVPQQSVLFKGTVASNVSYGDQPGDPAEVEMADTSTPAGRKREAALIAAGEAAEGADIPAEQLNRVRAAADVAQASEFVARMDGGYSAAIAQGGSNVSGGQKQRLSIARAVYRHPEILIFDDSFSALDFKTDREVRDALAREAKDSTKLIVAQRIGTIMNADRIVVLDDGHIADVGSHEELLHTSEIYREVYESQQKGGEDDA